MTDHNAARRNLADIGRRRGWTVTDVTDDKMRTEHGAMDQFTRGPVDERTDIPAEVVTIYYATGGTYDGEPLSFTDYSHGHTFNRQHPAALLAAARRLVR